MKDTFICHASEDKIEIVRPMVEAFTQAGISCWHDEAEIKWGDSITQKVNEGLRISRYVIVILSSSFMEKNWPQRELYAVLNNEASSGEVKVLPLLVGTELEQREIITEYPLLNDKRYLPWDGNLRTIVDAMLIRLGKDSGEVAEIKGGRASRRNVGLKIPIPKIRKKFSQRDRDLFLHSAFAIIQQYFQEALTELDSQYQEVTTDFTSIHKFKFLSTIYVNGEIANRCKVWIGGLTSSDSIAYNAGHFNIENDSSFNDILSIVDNEQVLGFKPLGISFGTQQYSNPDLLSAEEAAEYLWRNFTDRLG